MDAGSTHVVSRRDTLDGFMAEASQADGLCVSDVEPLTTVVVRTDNSAYRITILQPHAREVIVEGGACFAERTRGWLSGSRSGGSCLKLGWIVIGLQVELYTTDRKVVTSTVRSMAVEASATGQLV